jgi:predicted RNase H-like HicB family nuclease
MQEAVKFHVDGLREDGLDLPDPSSVSESVEV